ncbi:AMP-binding protein [Kineococcus sp. SYSU DK018]|uniref:AMP-binding protein n=1 Tax=Kineococcus sp. SYSU DK018 TaxID=3383139 RepID=UPI003D7C9A33
MRTATSNVTGGVASGLRALSEEPQARWIVPRIVEVALALEDEVVAGDGRERLTGRELLQRAALVREAVLAAGAHGRPVALLRGHDVGALAGVVGVVASGAPLVVLDPTTPAARLRHYVEAAGATICVTDAAHAETARLLADTVLDPEGTGTPLPVPSRAAESLLDSPAGPGDTAVIVYTSGSTGAPKGVACDHRSILHDAWVNTVASDCYGAGDVVVHLLPMAFSAGIGVTLSCLLTGARQELFDPRSRSVAELHGWMREVGATVLLASPAILRGLLAAVRPGETIEGLRSLTLAGETVHGAELAAIRRAVGPGCSLRNRYGSTETWLMAEHRIEADDPLPTGATPVGRAVPGLRFSVEDEHGRLHDRGTGRVVVTGRWLGNSYWGAPERTAEAFRDNPDGSRTFRTSDVGTLSDDGTLRLLGRTDHSVKVRGLLVEPGEVDALLFAQPDIREAVVVGRTSARTGRMSLVAHVVPEPGATLHAAGIRALVGANLPSHMVPEQVVFLDALPRTERGKLDRSALPEVPDVVGTKGPRNDFDAVVVGLFERVLEMSSLGIDTDFFAAGGDSLAAQALMAAIEEELGTPASQLSTALIAANPTPAQLSTALRGDRRRSSPTLVPLRTDGSGTPLFVVAGAGGVAMGLRPLAVRLPGTTVYGLQANGMENPGLPDWSIPRLAARHVRTLRGVQPHGPYRLAGHSMGGLVALEIAQQLTRAGEEVELLAILDSFPPDPDLVPRVFTPDEGLVQRVKSVAGLLATGVVPSRGGGHYGRFHRQGAVLQRRYRTTPYAGRAVVVVAQDDEDAGARRQWDRHLTGEWVRHELPGEHITILTEPLVGRIASLLAQELGALDGGRRAEPGATA